MLFYISGGPYRDADATCETLKFSHVKDRQQVCDWSTWAYVTLSLSSCHLFKLSPVSTSWLSNLHREIIGPKKVSSCSFVWRTTSEEKRLGDRVGCGACGKGEKRIQRTEITFAFQTSIFFLPSQFCSSLCFAGSLPACRAPLPPLVSSVSWRVTWVPLLKGCC